MASSIEPAVKRVLMSLLKRGSITARQAAMIGGVSRQAVEQWVEREGWDLKARQDAFAVREFTAAMNGGRRVRSKRELKPEAKTATDMWEWRRDTDRSVDLEEMGARQGRARA